MRAAAAAQADAEQALEDPTDFAVGQARLFVEIDNGRLGIGSELGGGGSQGIGRLQRMSALHAAVAVPAAADVHVELAVNGLARNLDLILLVDVGLLHGAATVRAGLGEWGLIGFIDVLGRLPVGFGAVVFTRFASGLFRRGLGRPFGKGGSLALAATTLFVEQALQLFDLGLEIGDLAVQTKTAKTWC